MDLQMHYVKKKSKAYKCVDILHVRMLEIWFMLLIVIFPMQSFLKEERNILI